ncbi:MAG: hypothetical protein R3F42_11995 [Pseudomonadota bacterium]
MNAIAQVRPLEQANNNIVEVVVYVKEELGEQERNEVVSALDRMDVIAGAEFCPLRNHLLLVKYDRHLFSSQQVLKSFTSLHLDARLIGPI